MKPKMVGADTFLEAKYAAKDQEKKDYFREWNTADFVGKYHLSKFENKTTSLPGTQVRIERDHIAGQEQRIKDREAYLAARAKRTEEMLRVKSESADMNTRIYFDTIVGQPMEQAEAILNEREAILDTVPAVQDTQRDIERYRRNIALGRHQYVSFAASAGFRSINYADPEFGYTALHIAVRKGHVATVEELLKHKADMDIQNRLGNRPIHECWLFHETHRNRTAEEREAQENTTCELLLKLLSYGTCPDSQDQKGQTPLHIACRLGPVRAVKIILGFKAKTDLKTNDGLTPLDVAAKHGQEECFKLISAWQHISRQLVHIDFHMIWARFLQDYTQIISAHKTAATILAEIDMSNSVRRMERSGRDGVVQIDDPLLMEAYNASKLAEKTPKPWEAREWAAFVKQKQREGTLDLKTQLENLQRQLQGYKTKKAAKHSALGALHAQPLKAARSPDKLPPPPKPRRLHALSQSVVTNTGQGVGKGDAHTQKGSDDRTAAAITSADDDASFGIQSDEESSVTAEEASKYHVARREYGQIKDFGASQLGSRRLRLAHKVGLDAKFLTFTKRLTTNSALLIPLRTPHAPHKGTEEEGDRIRAIVSQGPDFEKFEKYKKIDKFADSLGLGVEPKKNILGAYCEECEYSKPNERDALYERLERTSAEKTAAAALEALRIAESNEQSRVTSHAGSRISSRPATAGSSQPSRFSSRPGTSSLLGGMGANKNAKTVIEIEKREKIDLIQDKRPRYVHPELLPSAKPLSLVQKLSNEDAKRQADLLRKRQGLGTEQGVAAARQQMEEAIGSGVVTTDPDLTDPDRSAVRRKQEAEKALTMRKMFLQKEVPNYGEGRITSTHNAKGKIEEPWVVIKGRYVTLEGDRTA